jgi:heat shock protein HslJ
MTIFDETSEPYGGDRRQRGMGIRGERRLRAQTGQVFVAVAAVMMSVAVAGCAVSASGASASPEATHSGFAGYTWTVTAITHGGKRTPVPARYEVALVFTPNGQFGASDPVNYHSGTYRHASDGFTTGDLASTAAGYAGKDPITLLAMSAMSAFDNGVRAAASVSGDRMTISVGGYLIDCKRDGVKLDL